MADGVAVGSGSVIVLGAGIAGLAAADWLTDAGMCVTVLEGSARAGGNHRSREIGAYTFDVGSIFYEERAKLFSLAPELREMCPIVESHQRRIAPDGSIMLYPIEPLELVRQPVAELARSAANLLFARAFVQRDGTLDAICRKRLGSRFYETTGLRSYITRFYHVAPEHIDEEFFFRRMSIIERSTRLEAIARGRGAASTPCSKRS